MALRTARAGIVWTLVSLFTVTTSPPSQAADSSEVPSQSRVYIFNKCILTGSKQSNATVGLLASVFLPKLVDSALGSFGTWLENLSKARTTSYSATDFVNLYTLQPTVIGTMPQLNPNVRCVVFAKGRFADAVYQNPTTAQIDDDVDKPATLTDPQKHARLQTNHINLVSDPDIYFEGELIPSADGTALYLATRYLVINKLQSANGRTTRGFGITITLDGPLSGSDKTTLAAFVLNFGDRKAPTPALLTGSIGSGAQSAWVSTPGLTQGSRDALKAAADYRQSVDDALAGVQKELGAAQKLSEEKSHRQDKSLQDQIEALTTKKNKLTASQSEKPYTPFAGLMPVNLTVTVTETENENKFLALLADVFKNSKDDLSKDIGSKVSPEQRQQDRDKGVTQREADQTAMEKARSDYWSAKFDYEAAVADAQKAPNDLGKQKTEKLAQLALERATRLYNQALQALGQPSIT
jgi:hypothetical protein